MKFLFTIQGEGRGHMTQAIALRSLLTAAGHEVPAVLLGRSDRRKVPSFFTERIGCPVVGFASPNFVVDVYRRGIRIPETIAFNTWRLPRYWRSLRLLQRTIAEHRPDAVINFYDVLAGWCFALLRPPTRLVVVGHQYLLEHPQFAFPPGQGLDRRLLLLNNRFTSWRAREKLALSFRPMEDHRPRGIRVCPPLLRREALEAAPVREDFLLAYVLNDGYAEEIAAWHERHPEVVIHGFWDRQGAGETHVLRPNLIFHQLNDRLFLDHMRRCRGFLTTAGFESVCEALHLGKPVLMVPTGGHFEQRCNAVDAVAAGAGLWTDRFDLDRFLEYLPGHRTDPADFRRWVGQAPARFLELLEGREPA